MTMNYEWMPHIGEIYIIPEGDPRYHNDYFLCTEICSKIDLQSQKRTYVPYGITTKKPDYVFPTEEGLALNIEVDITGVNTTAGDKRTFYCNELVECPENVTAVDIRSLIPMSTRGCGVCMEDVYQTISRTNYYTSVVLSSELPKDRLVIGGLYAVSGIGFEAKNENYEQQKMFVVSKNQSFFRCYISSDNFHYHMLDIDINTNDDMVCIFLGVLKPYMYQRLTIAAASGSSGFCISPEVFDYAVSSYENMKKNNKWKTPMSKLIKYIIPMYVHVIYPDI